MSLGKDVYLLSVTFDDVRDVYICGDNDYRLNTVCAVTHDILLVQPHHFICLPYHLRHSNGVTILRDYSKDCIHVIDEKLMFGECYKPGPVNICYMDNPQCFCITPNHWMYVCDTRNNRIVRCIPGLEGGETWSVVLDEAQLPAKAPHGIEVALGGVQTLMVTFRHPPMVWNYRL